MSEETSKQYTTSAKVDHIRSFLEDNKEYRDIISSFIPRSGGIFQFNPMDDDFIFKLFTEDPEELKVLVKVAIVQIILSWGGEKKAEASKQFLSVGITDSNEIKMHDWNATYEGIPVAVNCHVISAFPEETYTKKAMVYCPACHKSESVLNLNRLPRCPNKDCENYRTEMQVVRASLKTGPVRMIMIQEPMEESKHGSPKILPCMLKDDDVVNTYINQRKRIIGVLRSEPQKFKSTNKIMIHAISVHDLDDVDPIQPTKEQIVQFEKMSKQDNYVSRIVDSFSPEIRYGGSELAKLCLILSILGGVKSGRLRGFIHALLLGDPSTAKSKMLEFIILVVQKAGFAVGGTASGAGVTVTLDRLPNGQKIPRIGTIPQCSGGCAAIDEMNQLEPEDLGRMFEVMESGRIHYNKGGVEIDVIAETAIQGGANPRGYYYDKNRTIVDNINMPGPLVQRFDLKVNLLDNQSNMEETKIRKHISLVRDIGVEQYVKQNNLLTPGELMVLFNHAKTFTPKMSPEAEKLLIDFDIHLREIPQKPGSLRIDRRFFESIGRITLAWAKLHLSNVATAEHAMTVIEVFKKTLLTFGMDVESGEMQLSMEDSVHSKKTAFVFAFKEEQQSQEADFILADKLLDRLVKKYPKLFKNKDRASDYFEQMRKEGAMTMREQRYRLE